MDQRALADVSDESTRADLLRGLAEASARLDQGKDAIAAASEAARIYAAAGRESDAALARYWLAYGLYQSDSEIDARSVLLALLDQVRSGLRVEPDFEMRLLTSLAAVESRAGQPTRALTYLEEARVAYLRHIGHPYTEWRENGQDSAVLEAYVRYLSPLRFDDVATVHLRLGAATRTTFQMAYLVTTAASGTSFTRTQAFCPRS